MELLLSLQPEKPKMEKAQANDEGSPECKKIDISEYALDRPQLTY